MFTSSQDLILACLKLMNPIRIVVSFFRKSTLILPSHLHLGLSSGLFPSVCEPITVAQATFVNRTQFQRYLQQCTYLALFYNLRRGD
jgi:hypothetical protein